MAPELIKWGEVIHGAISREVGVDSSDYKDLKSRAESALGSGDFETLEKVSAQINQINDFDNQISSLTREMTDVIKTWKVGDVNIEFPKSEERDLLELVETSETEDFEEDIYISNHTSPTQILELITKDSKGNFVHKNFSTIADLILKEEERENCMSIKKASRYIGVTRIAFAKRIGKVSEVFRKNGEPVKTVSELFEAAQVESYKDEGWKIVYDYIVQNYGSLSLEKFVNEVLLRSMRRKGSVDEEDQIKEEGFPMLANKILSPESWGGIEQILCGRLGRPEVVSRISSEFLNGQDFWGVAKSSGLISKDCRDPQELLMESCSDAFERRGRQVVEGKEQEKLEVYIKKIIETPVAVFKKEGVPFQKLSGARYLSLGIIYFLAEKCGGDFGKQDNLFYILFPGKAITIDGSGIVQDIRQK